MNEMKTERRSYYFRYTARAPEIHTTQPYMFYYIGPYRLRLIVCLDCSDQCYQVKSNAVTARVNDISPRSIHIISPLRPEQIRQKCCRHFGISHLSTNRNLSVA